MKSYALGTPSRLITFHPSYLALRPYPQVRQRQSRTLLLACADPRLDARDPRWTTQRAVDSPAFLNTTSPHGGIEVLFPCLPKFKYSEAERCPVPFVRATVEARGCPAGRSRQTSNWTGRRERAAQSHGGWPMDPGFRKTRVVSF